MKFQGSNNEGLGVRCSMGTESMDLVNTSYTKRKSANNRGGRRKKEEED